MSSSALSVNPLSGHFGAEVSGIDLAKRTDDALMKQLIDLLHQHHILVIHGQQLSDVAYVRFGNYWGKPLRFFIDSHLKQEYPELIVIHNSPDTPESMRDGAVHWHSDSSYEAVPASVTMLYAVEAPLQGGETRFVDMCAAYDALPEETQRSFDDLRAEHGLCAGPALEGERIHAPQSHKDKMGIVVHPLVMRHPVTGRRALFISGTAFNIVGWPADKGRDFIRDLKRHAVQPRFEQRCKAVAGDVLLWDNHAVMHTATPLEYSNEDGKRRKLFRISTKGLPAFYGG